MTLSRQRLASKFLTRNISKTVTDTRLDPREHLYVGSTGFRLSPSDLTVDDFEGSEIKVILFDVKYVKNSTNYDVGPMGFTSDDLERVKVKVTNGLMMAIGMRGSRQSGQLAYLFIYLASYYCAGSSVVGGKHQEMVSFGEKRAMRYAKDDPLCLLRHNYRQMTRVYPTGARFDSSNFDPMPLWNTGCQLGKCTPCLLLYQLQKRPVGSNHCEYCGPKPIHCIALYYFYCASIREGGLGSRNSVRLSVRLSVCHTRGL